MELAGGLNVHARFPTVERSSTSRDAVDTLLSAGIWGALGPAVSLGLSYEYSALGNEAFATSDSAQTLSAGYSLHALWLQGRYYLMDTRPSAYLAGGIGPAMQHARATGTRTDNPFVDPGTPFRCSKLGGFGGGVYAAVGADVDVSDHLAFLAQAAVAGHLLPGAVDTFGDCPAPGSGPAIQANARVGLAYLF